MSFERRNMKELTWLDRVKKFVVRLFCRHKVLYVERWQEEKPSVPVDLYFCNKCGKVKFRVLIYGYDGVVRNGPQ